MKTIILIVTISCFSVLSASAAKPLSEDFETYKLSQNAGVDIRNSNAVWRAHDKNMMKISIVTNPAKSTINSSEKVLKVERLAVDTLSEERFAPHLAWRGTYSNSFEIPFTEKNCIIEMKVLKANGGTIGVRIYPDGDQTSDYKIVTATIPASTDWQVVRFDFSTLASKMTSYTKFVFEIEKKATLEAQKNSLVAFIDDIKLVDKK